MQKTNYPEIEIINKSSTTAEIVEKTYNLKIFSKSTEIDLFKK